MLHNCLLSFLCIRFTDSHCIQQRLFGFASTFFFVAKRECIFSASWHARLGLDKIQFCALAFVMNLFHTNELSGRERRRSHIEHRQYALCPEMAPSPKARDGMFAGYPWRCAPCAALRHRLRMQPMMIPPSQHLPRSGIQSNLFIHASARLLNRPFSKPVLLTGASDLPLSFSTQLKPSDVYLISIDWCLYSFFWQRAYINIVKISIHLASATTHCPNDFIDAHS
jgi:hypothetical protein